MSKSDALCHWRHHDRSYSHTNFRYLGQLGRSQQARALCALGIHPDVIREPDRYLFDGACVLGCDLDPIQATQRRLAVTVLDGTEGTAVVVRGAEREDQADLDKAAGRNEDAGQWTAKIREGAVAALPPAKLLPDRQPAYVASWIYVFGVATIAALVVVIGTGVVLAVMGPSWWHTSTTGLFVNSLHLWSVEVFMFAMVIHLWGKFFMAAWRGKRKATWITGVVSFLVSVGAAFTGYLSQQNFDSQWISTQAKDGINSTGAGAIFNVTNFGQMLMWHIVLLPLCIVAIVGIHVLMVRLRGVVTPLPAKGEVAGDVTGPASLGSEVQS
jgi:hypothetical protein